MPRNVRPRSTLQSGREVQPQFGASHRITYTEDLDLFFGEVQYALEEVIPPKLVPKQQKDSVTHLRRKPQFRVFNDPYRTGVTVLERRLPRTYAHRNRIRWTKNDVGRIKGEIQNEISRLELGHQAVEATFTDVVRVGDVDDSRARKIALILDQESVVSELLVREHELVVNGISGSMKRFKHPYDSFVPHWTVVRINRDVGARALSTAVAAVANQLPVSVQLEPIRLYSQQDIDVEDMALQTFQHTDDTF